MRIIYVILTIMFTSLNIYGQSEFGHITITPYISNDSGINGNAAKLLKNKLTQIITLGEAIGGFDQRFIITPTMNILSETTMATIPQKTSIKVCFTFFIGDGISGSLFGSSNIEATGVGSSHEDALYSAIRKIDANDKGVQTLIADSKKRIVKYYNVAAPKLIKEAKRYIASNDYESALSKLSVIPALCQEYDNAQELVIKCGNKILERDNTELLIKAKAAWNTNPNQEGAQKASEYISQISIISPSYKAEVDKLNNQIRQRLIQIDNKEWELRQTKILSQENLRKEQINASERVTSSFFSILPDLVYSIIRWF